MRKTKKTVFSITNPRLFSQFLAFLLLYLDYCYLISPKASYLANCVLNILTFCLIIAIHNTISIDPGKISINWSKFIESQLSKDIRNEENYLKSNENSRISLMELNSNEKGENSDDISKFIEPDNPEEDFYMQAFSNIMRENKQKYRFCDKCEVFKPEFAKHCYLCQRCTLGFDHHDKILGKCIGIDNQKYYVLSIFYSTLAYFWIFIGFWTNGLYNLKDANILDFAGFCLGLIMSLALFVVYGLIFGFFILLDLWGMGMRDYYKGKRKKRKIKGNFGCKVWNWLLPFKEKRVKSEELFEEEINRSISPKENRVL